MPQRQLLKTEVMFLKLLWRKTQMSNT